MKFCGAKVEFTWQVLTWVILPKWGIAELPLFYKLKHDFENLDFWRKNNFFFLKMDEAWPNASNLEMDAWFLEILIFLKRWWWWSFFFWKWMRHGWMPLVYKLMHDFLKTLIFKENMISFFFFQSGWGMTEWPYFRNGCMCCGNLNFFFIKRWLWCSSSSFFKYEWGMAECP